MRKKVPYEKCENCDRTAYQKAKEKCDNRKIQLEKKYKNMTTGYESIMFLLAWYSTATTLFAAIVSPAFLNDCITFFSTLGKGIVSLLQEFVTGADSFGQLSNGISNSIISGIDLAKVAKQNHAVALVQLLNAGINYLPYRSIEEIPKDVFYKYKQEFIDAAIRCKKAGFDGVELHAAHGFYLNQVIETSERTDGYGGTFNCRVRLLSELIQEIRKQCGTDFIIAVRFGNHSTDELIATGKIIEAAGGDILDISSGMGAYQKPEDFPFDSKIFAASCVKKEVSLPVICVENIYSGEVAEQILQDGYADFIAVGRGHLCDPAWGNKVLYGKEPTKCLHCRNCMWYIDGEKCPVVKKRRKVEKI